MKVHGLPNNISVTSVTFIKHTLHCTQYSSVKESLDFYLSRISEESTLRASIINGY